jgi:hypothetical protein
VTLAFVTCCLLSSLCCDPAACAQPPAKKQDQKIKVTVVVILANDRCVFIDPRLKLIAAEAKSLLPDLPGFNLSSMTQSTVEVGEQLKVQCVEKSNVEITIRTCVDEDNKICLSITPPLQGELTYRTACGKFFPIMTRYKTEESIPAARAAKALSYLVRGCPIGSLRAAELLTDCRCQSCLMLAVCVEACAAK